MASSPCAAMLPPEILHLIFENVTEHSDLYSLCLVSRYFYSTAIRFLYRRVILPHKLCNSQEALLAPLNALLTSAQQLDPAIQRKIARQDSATARPYRGLSDCGGFVRYFKFDQRNMKGVVSSGGEMVEAAIENMARLESFVWQTVTTDSDTFSGPNIVRTPRISNALASKQNLQHLSLEKFFVDIDIPLLRLNPLRSFSFVLESGFVSFAHRRFPNLLSERTLNSPTQNISPAGDYDIIRKILQTSAKTLKILSVRSASNVRPQYDDEKLLFGGEPLHVSSFPETSAEEMLHLDNLECLSISGRIFTDSGIEILTQAIDFTKLRYLAIQNCEQVEKLIDTLSLLKLVNLRQLVIQASQPLLASFLGSFSGLCELIVSVESEALDWTAPGGLRRRFSTGEVTTGLLDAILKHADTLRSLSFMNGLPPTKKLFFGPAALKQLVGECKVLRDLRVCVNFSEWPKVISALSSSSSLVRAYFQQRETRRCIPPHVDLERYYNPKTTLAERLDLYARCYLRDLITSDLRSIGIQHDTMEAPYVYRIVSEQGNGGYKTGSARKRVLKRIMNEKGERKKKSFWNRKWEDCVILAPFREDY